MDRGTLSLSVVSAELDSAANGAYCKIYVDANDMTNGSGAGHDAASPDASQASTARDSAPRAFHTHVEKSDKKTYLPTWNETFTIDVYDARNEILTIRLKSKKLLHVSVVGACAIPLRQISTSRAVDQWFPILKGGKRRGKLRLQMTLTFQPPPVTRLIGAPQPSMLRTPPPPMAMPQTPPQPATLLDHRRSGSRRSSGGSSFSSQQRRSSLNVPSPNPYQQQPSPNPYQQPQQRTSWPQAPPTKAVVGELQPEAEPPKEQSPQRKDTVDHMYRPPTNPRMDLESDDDDETSFPRVAELHRLESDLIGESSDEEIDERGLGPLSPLYMERLTEDGAFHEDEERSKSPGSPGSSGSFERRSSASARRSEHERISVASASSNQRLSVQLSKPRPSVGATITSSESSPTSIDRRVSVEVARQTRVAVDEDEFVETVHFETEGVLEDLLGLPVDEPLSPKAESVVAGVPIDEVWSRYPSSSSSEELEAAYPDASIGDIVERSSASSIVIDDEEEAFSRAHETNQFVEPASPTNSSQHDEYEEHAEPHADFGTPPRGSISSDDGERDEFFGVERGSVSVIAVEGKQSSPRTSWVGEEYNSGAPQRKASSPRTSWVSEDVQTTNAASPRDRTSWVSESTSFVSTNSAAAARKESLPRSSWVSEQPSEQQHTSEYGRGSWVSESDRGSIHHDAAPRHNQSPRSSWVSEPADEVKKASARGSWVSESDRGSLPGAPLPHKESSQRGSWVSESDRGSLPGAPGVRKDSSARGSWISESDGGSFVGPHPSDAVLSPRNSWVSESSSSVAANVRRESSSSWVSESETASVVAGASRRHTSWISEHDDQSAPSPLRDRVPSSTSWVSESDTESVAAGAGRRQYSLRSSWISEHDDDTSASPARGRFASGTSWISEHDDESSPSPARGRFASGSSWISEHDDESSPSPARGRFASGTSWISEGDNTSFVDASAASPSNSWINESISGDASRTSWISEDQDTPPRRKESEDAEADRRRQRTRTSSFRTSWISESPQTNSFVDASYLRHSFVSEGSVGDEEREREDEDVTIMPSPLRDSMDEPMSPREDIAILASPVGDAIMAGASTPTRLSLVIESGDVESETDTTPRTSFAVEEVAEGMAVEEAFVSERISSSSSEEHYAEQHEVETSTSDRGSLSIQVNVDAAGEALLEVSSPAERSNEEARDSSVARVSVASADDAKGSVSSEDFEDSHTPRESLSSDIAALDDHNAPRSNASASSTPRNSLDVDIDARFDAASSSRDSVSSYEASDDVNYPSTPPLDSLSMNQLDAAEQFEAATSPRSSVSSERDQVEDGYSSYAESFGESVTRDSSVSSFSADNYVDRDDPDQHAEAVADAARYSSSSEDGFENHDARATRGSSVDGKATPPRHYSSASEDDTVDRSSLAVVETFDNSHAIPRYSSSSQDTEAQSTTWGDESSTNEELMDALRRVSQVSGVSDMYDLSPRSSEDVYSRSRQSSNSTSQQVDSSGNQGVPADLRRFISTVDVLVEPYDEDSPRSSSSSEGITESYTDAHTYNEDDDAEEVVESVDLDELVCNAERDESARSSISSEDVVTAVATVAIAVAVGSVAVDDVEEGIAVEDVGETLEAPVGISVRPTVAVVKDVVIGEAASARAEVAAVEEAAVVVETLTEISPLAVAAAESLVENSPLAVTTTESLVDSSPLSAVAVEVVPAPSSPHMVLDNIIATRDFVEDAELSPHSSLSSLSPRDSTYENLDASRASFGQRRSSSSRRRSSTGGRRSRKSSSQNVTQSAPLATEAATSPSETTPASTETRSLSATDPSAGRLNARAQSTLTKVQLSTVALDYLPSSDSESDEEEAFSSDADFNFDSD